MKRVPLNKIVSDKVVMGIIKKLVSGKFDMLGAAEELTKQGMKADRTTAYHTLGGRLLTMVKNGTVKLA